MDSIDKMTHPVKTDVNYTLTIPNANEDIYRGVAIDQSRQINTSRDPGDLSNIFN